MIGLYAMLIYMFNKIVICDDLKENTKNQLCLKDIVKNSKKYTSSFYLYQFEMKYDYLLWSVEILNKEPEKYTKERRDAKLKKISTKVNKNLIRLEKILNCLEDYCYLETNEKCLSRAFFYKNAYKYKHNQFNTLKNMINTYK